MALYIEYAVRVPPQLEPALPSRVEADEPKVRKATVYGFISFDRKKKI